MSRLSASKPDQNLETGHNAPPAATDQPDKDRGERGPITGTLSRRIRHHLKNFIPRTPTKRKPAIAREPTLRSPLRSC